MKKLFKILFFNNKIRMLYYFKKILCYFNFNRKNFNNNNTLKIDDRFHYSTPCQFYNSRLNIKTT